MCIDNKWGFVDENGVMVISPQLDCLYGPKFSGGLAAVSELFVGAGYIDRTGRYVVPLCYDFTESLTDGRGLVKLKGKYGFVNEQGELLTWSCAAQEESAAGPQAEVVQSGSIFVHRHSSHFRYDDAGYFSEGMGAVCLDGKWGYVNDQGDLVIKPRYEKTGKFVAGLAVVQREGKWGVIDKKGHECASPRYDYIGSSFMPECSQAFFDGLAVAAADEHVGFIDGQGRWKSASDYEDANHFAEGMAGVKKNGLWGFINQQGVLAILPCYENRHACLVQFSDGLAFVEKDGKCGFIDKQGYLVVPPVYENAFTFRQGMGAIKADSGRWGYVNQTGQEVIRPQYGRVGDLVGK